MRSMLLPRHSYTTRLLSTILPSACYAHNDKSIDGLHQAMVEDLQALAEDGVEIDVSWQLSAYWVILLSESRGCTRPRLWAHMGV